MAGGGEIKSVLTLDVSKFTVAIEKATGNLAALDKQLKNATAVSKNFEKDVSGLGVNVTQASEKFKLLDQSVAGLATKLGMLADGSFEAVSNKSRRAGQDIDALSTKTKKAGESMLSLSEWTKKYGQELEFVKPSLQNATKGHQELTKAQEATAKSAQTSAQSRIKTNLSMVESELATNKKIIAERQKLAAELSSLEQRIRAESMGHKNNADIFSRNVSRNGGQGRINQELDQASRLDGNADFVRKQREETVRLNQTLEDKNRLIAQSIAGLNREASVAERTANIEQIAARRAIALTVERSGVEKAAFEARRAGAAQTANFERDQVNQITNMWKGMGQLWAASKIEKGLGASVASADDMQRSGVSLQGLNIPKDQIEYITKRAWDDSAALKFVSALDMIKARLAMMGGMPNIGQEQIDGMLPQAAKAAHNIAYVTGDKSQKGFEDMIRNISGVIEARGQTHDPEAAKRTIDLIQKIYLGTGNKIDIADLETFLRRDNLGANTITDVGLAKMVAFLDEAKVSGHGGGGSGSGVSTVGTALKMFQKMANGGKMTESAVTEFAGAGLMDTSVVAGMDSRAAMKALSSGGLNVSDLSNKDPVEAFEKISQAAFAYMASPKNVKKYFGDSDVNSEEARRGAMRKFATLTGWSVTAQSLLTTAGDSDKMNRARASGTKIMNAKGADAMDEDVMKTYGANVDTFNASLTNLKVTLGTQLLPILTPVVKAASELVAEFVSFGRDNPTVVRVLAITAALGGVVLAIKGVASVFGAVGNLSSLLLKAAESAGITNGATSKLSAANISSLKAHVNATAGVRDLAAAHLASAQAHVNAASGVRKLAAIETQLLPAQRASAAATKEHTLATGALETAQKGASASSRLLSGGMTMLGGPVGVAILAITALAWAWDTWGNSAEKAANKAEDAANRATRALNGMSDAKDAANNAADITANKASLKENESALRSATKELAWTNSKPRADEVRRSILALAQERQELLKVASALGDEEAAIRKNIEVKNKTRENEKKALKDAHGSDAHPERAKAITALGGGTQLGGTGKEPRLFEDAFNKSFQDIAARARATELKVGSILSGEGSYAQQADALVNGKLLGGQFDNGHDPRNRKFLNDGYSYDAKSGSYRNKGGEVVNSDQAIDADGSYLNGKRVAPGTEGAHSLSDMKREEAAALELADSLKAVTYAKERSAAMDDEASVASKRLHEGLSKESDAYRALSREFERQEARNPAAKAASEDSKSAYSIEKEKALLNRARADMNNYGADVNQSNVASRAALLTTDDGALKASLSIIAAQHDAIIKAEEEKWAVTKSTFDKKMALQDRESDLYKKMLSDEELAQRAHDEKMAILAKQKAEATKTPLGKMLDQWSMTTDLIQGLNAKWVEGIAGNLETLVMTGKVEWTSLRDSMLKDLAAFFVRLSMANAMQATGLTGFMDKMTVKAGTALAPKAPGQDVAAGAIGVGAGEVAEAKAKEVVAINAATAATTAKTSVEQVAATTTTAKTGVEQVATAVETQDTAATVLGTVATKAVETPAEIAFATAIGGFSFALDMLATKMLTVAFSANGNAFGSSGLITAFAKGGSFSNSVVQTPTAFGFGGSNLGVMGEAGPEAVMPLTRNKNGVLGVSVNGREGGGSSEVPSQIVSINIVVNNDGSTDSKDSGDDTGAWKKVAERVKGVIREEITSQKRPGGLLYK